MNKRQKLVQRQFLNNEEAVIKRLNQVYRKSLSDVEDKIKALQFDIGRLQAEYDWLDPKDPEAEKIKSQIQSKIYQKQYQEQLQKQLDGILKQMQREQYLTVSEYLEGCYTDGFVGTIFDLSGQGVPLMMPIDQQSMVHAVQLDSKISHGLYTRLGEDVDLLKKKITAQVSRSIATGESFAQVARQLANVSSIGYNNAIRIARTEGHRIQTTATMDALYGAKERGADVVKQWDAALDARTRESHVKVDGEWKELEEKFSNGLRYPGDPHGAAAEVINCRCALLQRARWALADGFTKVDGFTGEIKSFDSTETYNEFKKAYFSKENRAYMSYVTELEEKYGRDFNKILSKMRDDEYKYFSKLEKARPQFSGMYRGDDIVKKGTKPLTNSSNGDIIKPLSIGKSLGAAAKNYPVKMPDSRQHVKLAEGQTIKGVTFAGKGTKDLINDRFRLEATYKIPADEWEKVSGEGFVIVKGKRRKAELHWYEANGKIVEMKIKRFLP